MWGLTRVADSAELVVCELVTNAITHGSGGTGGRAGGGTDGRGLIPGVHLDLSTDLARLHVDVWDTSPRAPVLTHDVPDGAEGGRGLLVVDALCQTWGADRVPGWPGKVVRAVLAIPEDTTGLRPPPDFAPARDLSPAERSGATVSRRSRP